MKSLVQFALFLNIISSGPSPVPLDEFIDVIIDLDTAPFSLFPEGSFPAPINISDFLILNQGNGFHSL